MKRLIKIVLAAVLAFSTVAALAACPQTETFSIKYTIDGVVMEGNPNSYTGAFEIALWKPASTKDELEWDGWYTNAEYTGAKSTYIPAGVTGNKEFFGRYIQFEFDITYHIEGEAGAIFDTYRFEETATDLREFPAPEGYALDGWYENPDFSGTMVSQIPAFSMGDKEYYGRYIDITSMYSIKYFIEGKNYTNAKPIQYAQSNSPITLWIPPVDPNKVMFDGWYQNSDFSGEKLVQLPAMTAESKIFYGKFKEPDSYGVGKTKETPFEVKDRQIRNVSPTTDQIGKKPVVILLWQKDCVYCQKEMLIMQYIYKDYEDKIEFMMINTGDTAAQVNEFISSKGYTFPYYYDAAGAVGKKYEVSTKGLPVMITVDLWGYTNSFDRGYPDVANDKIESHFREKFDRLINAANKNI